MTDAKRADEVEALIVEFQNSGLRELHVRCEGFELYLSQDPHATGVDAVVHATQGAPAAPAAASVPARNAKPSSHGAPAPVALPDDLPDGAVILRAPYMGTFYRAPKPGAPVYVEVGSKVAADTELCLVEVMKLFTAVRAGLAGHVHAILASDGQMVAADQPLFVVVPG